MLHPEVATRDCKDCLMYVYDEQTGQRAEHRGKPVRRPQGVRPSCDYPNGCPKGTPLHQRSLSQRNQRALDHFFQCRAVGHFPKDPIVTRHAQLISDVLNSSSESHNDHHAAYVR